MSRLMIVEVPSYSSEFKGIKEVTELIRCKECKHEPICTHSVQHTTHEPTSVTVGYKTVEWCSYGERKESE